MALIKSSVIVTVTPAVPPQPAVPPTPFEMYATPLPVGWQYFSYSAYSGGPQLPNSLATYNSWSQFRRAPTEYDTVVVGTEFKTIDELTVLYGTGFQIQSSWVPVFGPDPANPLENVLTGYIVPVKESVARPPAYYGPIEHMTFVDFSDYETEGHGYPIGPGPFTGYMYIATTTGQRRVSSTYHKDFRGVLLRTSTDPLPAYCTQSGPCRIVVQANFPGRSFVPGEPAVRAIDVRPGWNSGGNSVDAFEGDCRTVFMVELVTALAVGLAPASREDVGVATNLTHAFYFALSETSVEQYFIMERGRTVLGPRSFDSALEYEIVREGGVVSYLVDGVVVYTSTLHSSGAVRVGSAMYLAGDGVL